MRSLGFQMVTAVLALLGMSQVAIAGSTNPSQNDVCTDGILDREKLAIFVLDKQSITRRLDQWAAVHLDTRYASVMQRIAADEAICTASGVCSGEAKLALSQAQSTVEDVLKDNRSFDNPRRVIDPATFFSDRTIVVQCRTRKGTAVEMVGVQTPAYKYKFPLRVRGTADALIFVRETTDFKVADKATLSFTDENLTHKRTTKVTAVVGYPFTLRDGAVTGGNDYAELIPYAGLSRNASRVDNQAKSVTTDNFRFGTVLSYRASRIVDLKGSAFMPITHILLARPEYLINKKDDSEVASLNLTYMPVINTIPGMGLSLNAYRRIDPKRARFLSYRPILDFRFNSGTWTRQGSRAAADARDFSRAGILFGVAISHDDENVPLDLTISRSYLWALAGEPNRIGQFKTALSFAPDPKRYFSFDVSYVRGRREDLADPEDLWTIGFGIKY